MMEWIKQITDMTGVTVQSFLLVSAIILVLVATARYVLGKKALEEKRWWKAVLTVGSMALGIGGAFLAVSAGLYTHINPAMTVIVGIFNGTLATASHQVLKQIPFLDKILKGVAGIILVVAMTGCGSWLQNTRTTLLATNASLNAYDDVAAELWKDAPTNPKSKKDLETSLCATVITQDAIIQTWSVTTAVKAGIAKEDDITPYIGTAITALDSLEDYLDMGGVPVPVMIKAAIEYLETLNPGGYLPEDAEPLEDCVAILEERFPMAGYGGVPWDTILSSGAELALFMIELIRDAKEKKDIDDDALENHIRDVLKQAVLYEKTLGE